MTESNASRTSFWTIIAAIGGLLSGVAAVLALFITQPQTMRIFIPIQVLQQAAQATGPASQPATPLPQYELPQSPAAAAPFADGVGDIAQPSVETPPHDANMPPSISPAPPQPIIQSLGNGVTLSLISFTDTPDNYVATFRVENGSGTDVGVAMFYNGMTNVHATDGLGGSCRMAVQNGTTFPRFNPQYEGSPADFQMLPSTGRVQYVGVFEKRSCQEGLNAGSPISITGSFVVFANGRHRTATATFDGADIQRRQ